MEEIDKPSILVTGGTGFIGSYVLQSAIAKGWSVTSASLHLPSDSRLVAGVKYLQVDLTVADEVNSLVKDGFDYVVNLAGYIDHKPFNIGGRDLIDAHFLGVMNLGQFLPKNKLKRFVQIGSSDEYGSLSSPQKESHRERPISPYSLGKVAAAQFLQMLHRTENFPSVVLRLFLTYGPGQSAQRFLPQIIKGCIDDRDFPVSSGEQVRDFCYIEDVAEAILLSLTNQSAIGEIFNIASGVPVTIRSIVENVNNNIGKGNPVFGEVPYRAGESMELFADIQKARLILGWSPKTSLEDGLNKTVDWYGSRL